MLRRSRRISTALLAVIVMLMSQLAVSAHACGIMGAGSAAIQVGMSSPCPDLLDSSNLCDQHCQFGASSVDSGKPLQAVDVALGPVLRIVQPFISLPLVRRSRSGSPPPPEPPLAIRFPVLRI